MSLMHSHQKLDRIVLFSVGIYLSIFGLLPVLFSSFVFFPVIFSGVLSIVFARSQKIRPYGYTLFMVFNTLFLLIVGIFFEFVILFAGAMAYRPDISASLLSIIYGLPLVFLVSIGLSARAAYRIGKGKTGNSRRETIWITVMAFIGAVAFATVGFGIIKYKQWINDDIKARIDESALITDDLTPTISGTFDGKGDFCVHIIRERNTIMPENIAAEDFSSMPNFVWERCTPYIDQADGVWSTTVDVDENLSILRAGTYTIVLYNLKTRDLLAEDTLVIGGIQPEATIDKSSLISYDPTPTIFGTISGRVNFCVGIAEDHMILPDKVDWRFLWENQKIFWVECAFTSSIQSTRRVVIENGEWSTTVEDYDKNPILPLGTYAVILVSRDTGDILAKDTLVIK